MAKNLNHRYLITGGAGAIGSVMVNELSENSENLIDVIDNLDSGFERNIIQRKNVNVYKDSILNEELLASLEDNNYSYILHLAALFANQTSVENPVKDLQVNSLGTLRMLEFSRRQPKLKKFLYTSSSCIYGNGSNAVMEEDDIPNPETPYAITKLNAEYYTNFYNVHYELPTNVVRLFNIYGSNEYPGKYRNVIPNFVHMAANNHNITVMGDGTDTRDFTHIDDALEKIFGVLYNKKNLGLTFNIGSGSEVKIIDLANHIIEGMNSKSKIVFIPKRKWDKVKKRKACTKRISVYKKTSYKELKSGLVRVYEFYDDIREHIDDSFF